MTNSISVTWSVDPQTQSSNLISKSFLENICTKSMFSLVLLYIENTLCYIFIYYSLFICDYSSNSRIYHSYGDVITINERHEMLTCTRHLLAIEQ